MNAVEFNNLSRSDGSVMLALGESVIQAAVYGPGELGMTKTLYDKTLVGVMYKSKRRISDHLVDRSREEIIKNSLESCLLVALHPRASVTVILQEVENCGNLLACCLNSAVLAVLDAGISMKCTVAAVCAVIGVKRNVIVTPTKKEHEESVASMTFTFESIALKVIGVEAKGVFSEEEYETSLSSCRLAVKDMFEFYRSSAAKGHNKFCS